MQIHLRDIKIYAYHGLHVGEDTLGGEYEVNLTVVYMDSGGAITGIAHTVNYVALYEIVKAIMAVRKDLLEAVATDIASEIIAKFPIVESVEISIFKLHPPIQQFQGAVGVTYKLKR